MSFNRLTPMLNVSNIEASLAFYRDALGFEVVSPAELVSEWRWATIGAGAVELMLSESGGCSGLEQGTDPHADESWPTIFYFYPQDLDALHRQATAAGYAPQEIKITCYGMREFSLQDPDGHMLSFGVDAET